MYRPVFNAAQGNFPRYSSDPTEKLMDSSLAQATYHSQKNSRADLEVGLGQGQFSHQFGVGSMFWMPRGRT